MSPTNKQTNPTSQSLADIVFQNAAEGIAITDTKGNLLAANNAFSRLTGYSVEEVQGKPLSILSSGRHPPSFYQTMWKSIHDTGRWQGEIWNRHKNGEIYPEWLSINSVRDDQGNATNYVGVFTDISQIIESQTELRFLAHHDPVTQLPNRSLFNDRFRQAVLRALRDLRQLGILFIDLNQVKSINDSHGHTVGDTLLAEIAKLLTPNMREFDTLARFGGSELILLVEDIDGPRSASLIADKILKTFISPVKVGEDQVFVSANIGISIFPMDGHELNDLIANADAAMHEARAHGRNTYRFFSDEMSAFSRERMSLEHLLRQSIEQNELSVNYQPQFDATSLKVVGVEALLRWTNPMLGIVGPERFVPVAEDNGLIHPIGTWIMREACRQFVEWQKQGVAPQTLSINVSAKQIELGNFVETIEDILLKTGLKGEFLEFELTESVLTDVAYVVPTIEALHELGIRISIDDFGTGFSSLNYLKTLPISKLKIDRSFILDIGRSHDNDSIVRAIIGLAHTLGLSVIAEGVETEDQAEFLRREGCNDFQGHLLGRAVSASDFSQYFSQERKPAS